MAIAPTLSDGNLCRTQHEAGSWNYQIYGNYVDF